MKTYRAYLFNLNNTLVQSRSGGRGQGEVDTVLPGGEPAQVRPSFGAIGRVRTFRRDGSGHAAAQESFSEGADFAPIDGADQSLRVLRRHGRFLGIYTSRDRAFLDACLAGPLAQARDGVGFTLSLLSANLPPGSPQVVAVMRERYRLSRRGTLAAADLLVVGDALSDCEMARRAGADFAALTTGGVSRAVFAGAGVPAEMIFSGIGELLSAPADHGVVVLVFSKQNELLLLQEGRPGHPYQARWAGPHGVCERHDVVEEQTVVRETREECGLQVRPLRRLAADRPADTKVSTVSFWEAELIGPKADLRPDAAEAADARWVPLHDLAGYTLYPGMHDFLVTHRKGPLGDRSRN